MVCHLILIYIFIESYNATHAILPKSVNPNNPKLMKISRFFALAYV